MSLKGKINLYLFQKDTGNLIYEMELGDPNPETNFNGQLIAPLLSAIQFKLDELNFGMESEDSDFRRGADLCIVYPGAVLHAALILRSIGKLNRVAHQELHELTRAVIGRIECDRQTDLHLFFETGKVLSGLSDIIQEETRKMCQHMFTSYLLEILGQASNDKRFKKFRADEMICGLVGNSDDADSAALEKRNGLVKAQLLELMHQYTSFKHYIRKTNALAPQVWNLFQVPIVQFDPIR